jgi:hypothetical protein
MRLVPRILLLTAISVGGIALLAPLAARSADPPVAVDLADRLLPAAPASGMPGDRGTLSARQAAPGTSVGASPERLDGEALPTPVSAPMEATLHATATPPPAAAPAPAARAPATYSGDSVWDDLARCESGGNWSINTGNGYYGGLQFSHGTWHNYGGGEFADYPHQATREEQIVVAERLRAVRGYAPWPACRDKLGLP